MISSALKQYLSAKLPERPLNDTPLVTLCQITKHVYTALHRNKNKALFVECMGIVLKCHKSRMAHLISLRSKEGESNEKERLEGAGAMRT